MGGMMRRWVIRVAFLLALGCVLSVWVGSYFGWFAAYYTSSAVHRYVGASGGLCDMIEDQYVGMVPSPLEFHFFPGSKVKDLNRPPIKLGFYWGKPVVGLNTFEIVFPLWLPAVVLAGLNWFVWRKTRAKAVGQAFPVEVGSEGEGVSASSP